MVGFMRSPQIRQFRIQKLSHVLFSSVQCLLLCCLILVVSITSCKFVLRLDVMIEDLGFDFIMTMSALVTTTLCVIVILWISSSAPYWILFCCK